MLSVILSMSANGVEGAASTVVEKPISLTKSPVPG
jgi:hypothetical protein